MRSSPSTPSTNGSNLSFNDFWKQTYDHVRQQDPNIKITGPSVAGYNQSYLSGFLSYCKTNNCLPDIVGWHDGSYIQNNVQSYRALEKQLGIGPLPITINEYSSTADVTHEGEPGASAALIAAMERTRVDSACITFWDVAHPGRLGSLLASDTQTNGGWFFYRWYGEMTGQMLTTTSSLGSGNGNFDGFASLDATTGTAAVLAGGTNDGTLQIVVKGFKAASAGSTVHAVVEYTPWVNRNTVVTSTTTISTSDLTASGDQVAVTINNANATNGYHVTLTWPGGGWVDAAAPDSGGGAMDAGTVDASTGTSTSAGSTASGSNMSGASGSGGTSTSTSGGSVSPGAGSPSVGTASGTGSAPGATASSSAGPQAPPSRASGCSCSTAQHQDAPAIAWLGAVALGLVMRGRKGACAPRTS